MKKFPWKNIFVIVFLGVGVFIVVEFYKVISAGEKDLASIFTAPWTAAKKVWSAITGFFTGLGGSSAPGTIAGTGQTAAQLLGTPDNSPVGQMLDNEAPAVNAQLALGNSGLPLSTPVSSSGDLVGIWGT